MELLFAYSSPIALSGGIADTDISTTNYVDDVFCLYGYTGNGAQRDLNPGFNCADGKVVSLIKSRSQTTPNYVSDSSRGRSKDMSYSVPFGGALTLNYRVAGSSTVRTLTGNGVTTIATGATNISLVGLGGPGSNVTTGDPTIAIVDGTTYTFPGGDGTNGAPINHPGQPYIAPFYVEVTTVGMHANDVRDNGIVRYVTQDVINNKTLGGWSNKITTNVKMWEDGSPEPTTQYDLEFTYHHTTVEGFLEYRCLHNDVVIILESISTINPTLNPGQPYIAPYVTYEGGAVLSTQFVNLKPNTNLLLATNSNTAQSAPGVNTVISALTTGIRIGTDTEFNTVSAKYIAKIFKARKRFMMIEEYVGDGTAVQIIPVALDTEPGMIWVKSLEVSGEWYVRHSHAAGELTLNGTGVPANGFTKIVSVSNSSVGVAGLCNTNNVRYAMYVFANDSAVDSIIKTGIYSSGKTRVVNSLTGASSITVPAGVTQIRLKGNGGPGTTTLNPGQAFVAGTPEVPAGGNWNPTPVYSNTVNIASLDPLFVNTIYFADGKVSTSLVGHTAPQSSGSIGSNLANRNLYRPPTFMGDGITLVETNSALNSTNPALDFTNWDTLCASVVAAGGFAPTNGYMIYAYFASSVYPYQPAVPEIPYVAPFNVLTTGVSFNVLVPSSLYAGGYTAAFAGGNGGPANIITHTINLDSNNPLTFNYNVPNGATLTLEYDAIIVGSDLPGEIPVTVDLSSAPNVEHTVTIPPGASNIRFTGSGGTYGTANQGLTTNVYFDEPSGQNHIFAAGTVGTPVPVDSIWEVTGTQVLQGHTVHYICHGALTLSYTRLNSAIINTNQLTGSGNLSIPAGVSVVRVFGKGVNGSVINHPEVPFIAAVPEQGNSGYPSGLPPYNVTYTGALTLDPALDVTSASSFFTSNLPTTINTSSKPPTITVDYNYQGELKTSILNLVTDNSSTGGNVVYSGTVAGTGGDVISRTYLGNTLNNNVTGNSSYPSGLPVYAVAIPEQTYAAAYTETITGANTTLSVAGFNKTYSGGVGVPAVGVSESIVVTNTGHTLTYVVPVGGELTVSYDNPIQIGYGTFIRSLTGNGSISIPAGIGGLKITAKGGAGTWLETSPGQEAIPPTAAIGNSSYPSGLPPYRTTIPAIPQHWTGTVFTSVINSISAVDAVTGNPPSGSANYVTNHVDVFNLGGGSSSTTLIPDLVTNLDRGNLPSTVSMTLDTNLWFNNNGPIKNYALNFTLLSASDVTGEAIYEAVADIYRYRGNVGGTEEIIRVTFRMNLIVRMVYDHYDPDTDTDVYAPTAVLIPTVPSVPQVGLPEYVSGLPPYVPANPGQPYIAPTFSTTIGTATTTTVLGVTHTYPGGNGGTATTIVENVLYPGATGDTMNYSVAPGGSLEISSGSSEPVYTNIGFEAQCLLVRNISTGSDWKELDIIRGITDDSSPQLSLNTTATEIATAYAVVNSTGFKLVFPGANELNESYIFMAIARSNKPPTSGNMVYAATNRIGNGNATDISFNFTPDVTFARNKAGGQPINMVDRSRGGKKAIPFTSSGAQFTPLAGSELFFDNFNTIRIGAETVGQSNGVRNNIAGEQYVLTGLKRAAKFMDEIIHKGTSTVNVQRHSLRATPELWVTKCISGSGIWTWGSSYLTSNEYIASSNGGKNTDATVWNDAYPSNSLISFGASIVTNNLNDFYSTLMFSTVSGVSKVFQYVGDGNVNGQLVNCDFVNGARCIILLRVDQTIGGPLVWDYAHGIIAGADPHYFLHNTANSSNVLDTIGLDARGFVIKQNALNANQLNGRYIGLAIA